MSLYCTETQLRRAWRHCEAAMPFEAVGVFVAARDGEVAAVCKLPNKAANPRTQFFVDPNDQFLLERELWEHDRKITGVYHSHVHAPAEPSESDWAFDVPGRVMVIFGPMYMGGAAMVRAFSQRREVALYVNGEDWSGCLCNRMGSGTIEGVGA